MLTAVLALVSALLPFDGNTGWIDSKPLTPASLHGKVVLVDFWEYTCVNCLKTLPYERTWYDRYAKYGFTIVSVHTPEFKFSGEPANVAAAVKRLGVDWPVVLDSRQTIWDRYANDVWPRELLFDQNGKLIADHSGEGDYPDMERRIQQALRAHDPSVRFPAVMDYLPGDAYSKPGAVCYRHTPEMYLGNWRGDGALGNVTGYGGDGRTIAYLDATPHDEGRAYLQGSWFESGEALVNGSGSAGQAHLAVSYRALQVVAVLRPHDVPAVDVLVLQDGAPLTAQDAGADIRFDPKGRSYLRVDAPREYDVVMNKHFAQHDLELLPQHPGLGAYTFDFEACEVGADR